MTITERNPITVYHGASLGKRMLQGAAIALVLISLFVIPVEGRPEWGRFWMIRPLMIVPVAGALGGVFYYFMDEFRTQGAGLKLFVNFLSLLVYIIGLWLGTVLGLDGTLWN